jgi:metal-responsive CopG/Arc/MetJ family transcriptional regulator
MVRATFSLDEATLAEIKRTAERLRKPQSHIIREAVADYAARTDRLSERERRHVLDLLERLHATKPSRSQAAVDRELVDLRSARRTGGRRHRS